MKKEKISQIRKKMDLKSRLATYLINTDEDNWEDGFYIGDATAMRKYAKEMCYVVKEWLDDGAPGIDELKKLRDDN